MYFKCTKLCSDKFWLTFYAAIGSWRQRPAWAALLTSTDIRPEERQTNTDTREKMRHWWPLHNPQSNNRDSVKPQVFAWQTDLIANAVIVSDHCNVAGRLIWTPKRLHYNCIFSDKNFRASHEILSDYGSTSPSFCYPRVQSEYRIIWALRGLWETHGTWKAPCIFCKSLSKWEMTSFKQF